MQNNKLSFTFREIEIEKPANPGLKLDLDIAANKHATKTIILPILSDMKLK